MTTNNNNKTKIQIKRMNKAVLFHYFINSIFSFFFFFLKFFHYLFACSCLYFFLSFPFFLRFCFFQFYVSSVFVCVHMHVHVIFFNPSLLKSFCMHCIHESKLWFIAQYILIICINAIYIFKTNNFEIILFKIHSQYN